MEHTPESSIRVDARRIRKGLDDNGIYLCDIGTRDRVLGRVLLAGSYPFARRRTLTFFADARYERHLQPNLYLRVCQNDGDVEYPHPYRGKPPRGLLERARDWLSTDPDSLPAVEPPQMKGVRTLETLPPPRHQKRI